jgi:hypothetical protein
MKNKILKGTKKHTLYAIYEVVDLLMATRFANGISEDFAHLKVRD